MTEPHKPGQPCRIINSSSGTEGHTVGKKVVTVFLHDVPLLVDDYSTGAHRVINLGPIWRVRGEGLISNYGGVGDEVDCAQCWLEVEEPEPPKVQTTVKEKELTQ